jgi:aryl carrier-like protein
MNMQKHLRVLPTAAMLLAALLSYFGAPRMMALAPLMNGGLSTMRMLDLSERLRANRALASLKPLSAQAKSLAAQLENGSHALSSALGAAEFLSAPAPALADSSLSYLAPRPQMVAPDFTQNLAGLLGSGINTFNRPPPLLERATQLFETPLFGTRGLALTRAPPIR